MGVFDIFGFGQGGWGLAMLRGAGMTSARLRLRPADRRRDRIARRLGAALANTASRGRRAKPMPRCFAACPSCWSSISSISASSTLLTGLANLVGYEGFVGVPSFLAGSLAVGVISGSYQAEVFRAAYLAIARGELEAAVSVGMDRFLMFRRIIAPQVLRFALPGLGNLWQVALKDSSLISVTGLTELMRVSQIGAGSTHQPFVFYLGGMALYLFMTLVTTRVFDIAEARATRGMRRAAG